MALKLAHLFGDRGQPLLDTAADLTFEFRRCASPAATIRSLDAVRAATRSLAAACMPHW